MSTYLAIYSMTASAGNETPAAADAAVVTLAEMQSSVSADASEAAPGQDAPPASDSLSGQASSQASADSVNQAYTEIWQGADTQSSSGLEKALASNDLIFVVLTVSLIIWSVLLTYIIRLDRNVSALERRLDEGSNTPAT